MAPPKQHFQDTTGQKHIGAQRLCRQVRDPQKFKGDIILAGRIVWRNANPTPDQNAMWDLSLFETW